MGLRREEVEHIAELARLGLTEAEIERYGRQLNTILDHVARLQELDTSSIPPTSSVQPAQGRLRPDEVRPGLTREELLRNAPDVADDQFQVPPILD